MLRLVRIQQEVSKLTEFQLKLSDKEDIQLEKATGENFHPEEEDLLQNPISEILGLPLEK